MKTPTPLRSFLLLATAVLLGLAAAAAPESLKQTPPAETSSTAPAPDGFALLSQAVRAIETFDLPEAERLTRLAVGQTTKENGGETHPAVASALVGLGRTLFRQERFREAAEQFVRAQAILDQTTGAASPDSPVLAEILLESWHRALDPSRTLAAAEELARRLAASPTPDEARMLTAGRRRGEALLALNRLDEADAALREAQDRTRRLFGEAHPSFASLQGLLEEIRRRRGETVVPAFVGALGSPRKLSFEGNTTFAAGDLRKGLLQNPPTFNASHPSAPLAAYLQQVQSALVEGYRHAGFRDVTATVEVEPDGSAIRVLITEGRRFRSGAVRIEGLREVDGPALVKSLTVKPKDTAIEDHLAKNLEAMEQNASKGDGKTEPSLPGSTSQPIMLDRVAGFSVGNPSIHQEATEKQKAEIAAAAGNLQKPRVPFSEMIVPVWVSGQPVSFAASTQANLASRIEPHFFDQGRPRPRFEIQTVPDETTGAVELVVRVLDEGPACVVGKVTVTGAVKNSPQEMEKFLGLKPGAPLRRQTLRDAHLALWECGRFRDFTLTATTLGKDRPEIDVAVTVTELGAAPPLREPLAAELEALLRCAKFLSSPEQWNGDLVVEMQSSSPDVTGLVPAAQRPASVSLLAAYSLRDGFAGRLSPSNGRGPASLFALNDQHLDILVGSREFPLAWRTLVPSGGPVRVIVQLMPSPEKDGDGSVFFGLGTSTRNEGPVVQATVTVAPALLLGRALDTPPRFSRRRGEVTIGNPKLGRLRIEDRTGRLIEWVLPSEEAGHGVLRLQSGVVRRLAAEAVTSWNRTPDAQRIETCVATPMGVALWLFFQAATNPEAGVGSFTDWIIPKTREKKEAVRAGLQVVRALDGVLRRIGDTVFASDEKPKTDTDDDPPFFVPMDPKAFTQGNALFAWLGPMFFSMVDGSLPPESWLWKFSREVGYLTSGRSQSSDGVFAELVTDPTVGPVGCLLVAQVLHRLNHPAALDFLRRSTSLTRKEDFRRDWRLLTDLDWFGRDALQAGLDQVVRLTPDELKALSAGLPKEFADWLGRTVASLKAKQGLPLAEVLGPGLDDLWESSLAGTMRQYALNVLQPPDPPVDAALVAATVNGTPITRKEVAATMRLGNFFPHLAAHATTDAAATFEARAADTLVLANLAVLFFNAQKGTVDESQFEQIFKQMVGRASGGDEAAFLASAGLSRDEFLSLLRTRSISGFITEQIGVKVPPVSDAEVDAAAPEWLREQAAQRHLHLILLPPDAPADVRMRWTGSLRDLVADGVPFDVLMQACSGPLAGSQIQGQCLGEDAGRELTGPWREAVDALEPGGVTSPLATPSGAVALFSLVGKRDGPAGDPTGQRETIRETVHRKKQAAAVHQWFTQARAAARIRIVEPPPADDQPSPTAAALAEFAKRAPFSPAAHVAHLFSQLRQDDAAAAEKSFVQLEIIDMTEEAWKQLSAALLAKNQPVLAERAARGAVRIDPASASSHLRLGQALAAQKKLPEAQEAMRKSIKLQPTRAEGPLHLGLVLEQQGRLDDALAEWRRAAQLSPDAPEPWTALARGLAAAGHSAEAEEAAHTAAAKQPAATPAAAPPAPPPGPTLASAAPPNTRHSSLLDLGSLSDELRPVSLAWESARNPAGAAEAPSSQPSTPEPPQGIPNPDESGK